MKNNCKCGVNNEGFDDDIDRFMKIYGKFFKIKSKDINNKNEYAKLESQYAELNKTTISEFVRNAIMEKIEDEYDLECYYKAKKEFDENPKTYTLEEIKKELGL